MSQLSKASKGLNSFLTYFPVPTFLKMPSVGIDISAKSLHLLEIVEKNGCHQIGKFDSIQLQNPITFSADISQNQELRTILSTWKKKHRLTFVEVSLPEEEAYLYKTDVPQSDVRGIREAIEFNLEENVPLSPTEAVFDFKLLGEGDKPDTFAAVVTVIPEKIASQYYELLSQCGLTAVSFLMEAQALSKSIVPQQDPETYFVMHVCELKTVFFIVSRGTVRFTSAIQVGAEHFTAALIKQFGSSHEDAEKMKFAQGFLRTKENTGLDAMTGTASTFNVEINRIFSYWHTHKDKHSDDIEKCILSGKDASIPGFKEFISQSIRVPFTTANVWTNMCSFDEYVPPISKEQSDEYGIAIGLALPKGF